MTPRAFILTAIAASIGLAPNSFPPISEARLSNHVRILSSDAFEGRAPGTAGETKTIAYLISQFRKLGLQPGGLAGSWTQALDLVRIVHDGPIRASIEIGGRTEALLADRDVILNSADPSGRVSITNAPLIFVGHGIDAPPLQWNDFKDADLRGKVVVMLAGEPSTKPFSGHELSAFGQSRYKFAQMIRRGAAGVLQISPEGAVWITRANSASVAQYAAVRADVAVPPFSGFVAQGTIRKAFAASGLDYDSLTTAAERADFRPVDLPNVRLSIFFKMKRTRITTHNVIARLTGQTRPGDTLIYTAHWDHLGRGRPDARGDSIYNGAIDNASGVAGLLELARAFSRGPRPERSIVFMATTGEELGFWGVRYYVEHPIYPLATTVADINMDTLPLMGPTRTVQVFGYGKTSIDQREIESAAAQQGRDVDRTAGLGGTVYNRIDSLIFARDGGVPVLSLGRGKDRVDPAPFKDDYDETRYHRPGDEWSSSLDLRGGAQNLQLLYFVGRDLANSDEWPEWLPGTEFKALRDRSDAARHP